MRTVLLNFQEDIISGAQQAGVPGAGVEPARPFGQQRARLLCLPVSPPGHPNPHGESGIATRPAALPATSRAQGGAGGEVGGNRNSAWGSGFTRMRRLANGRGQGTGGRANKYWVAIWETQRGRERSPGLVVHGGGSPTAPCQALAGYARRTAESTPGWLVCPGRDSNPYGLSASTLARDCVYHFHHPGTRIRAGVVVTATRSGQEPATSRAQGGADGEVGGNRNAALRGGIARTLGGRTGAPALRRTEFALRPVTPVRRYAEALVRWYALPCCARSLQATP